MEKVKTYLKKYYKVLVIFLCLIVLIDIIEDVFNNNIIEIDTSFYKLISENLISDQVTPIMKFVTNLGGKFVLISLGIILFITLRKRKLGIYVALNLIIITIINQLLKHIVQRPRPNEYRIVDETGYSFPSGHSMVSTAFYGFLIYLICKYVKNKYLKYISTVLLSFLILWIGVSRIYLGVHYTTDVLAGFLISISYLIIYISILNNLVFKEKE